MPSPSPTSPAGRIAQVLRVGIVLATVWWLAAAAQHTLSGLLYRGAPSSFVIQAQEKEPASPAAGPRAFWIEDLLVDGERRRLDSLQRTGDWQVKPKLGVGTPLNLLLERSTRPAGVTFQGKRFLMVARADQWTGQIRVERNGRHTVTVAAEPPSGQVQVLVVEDPVAKAARILFVVALLVFAAAAWGLAPIRAGRGSVPWVVFSLVVGHLLFWVSQWVGTTNDSVGYLNSLSLLRGGVPSYFPPGYPALLGLVELMAPEHLGRWVTLSQHAMAVAAGVWTYQLIRRITREELALLGGLSVGVLSPILTLSQSVMSEIPTLFAMVGGFYFTVRTAETGRVRFAILAGLLTGWAGTLRVVPLAGLLPAICIILLIPFSRRGLRLAGLTCAVTAGVVLLPMAWFWYESGQPRLADSTGLHLFNRMVLDQKQLDEKGPSTQVLLGLLDGDDPRGVPHWTVREHPRLREMEYAKVERLFRAVALEGIRKDPAGYLLYTPVLAWKELLADPAHLPWGNGIMLDRRLEVVPPVAPTADAVEWRWRMERCFRSLWPILCWGAIAGTLAGMLLPKRKLVLALACVPIGCMLASAAVDSFAPRYQVPVIPFVVALALLPLGMLLSAASSKRRPLEPALEQAA